MSVQTPPTPSLETQAMLDCLRQAVANTLERKRRLGQYAVLWSGETPTLRDRSRVVPRSDRACVFTEHSVVKMQALRNRVESLR